MAHGLWAGIGWLRLVPMEFIDVDDETVIVVFRGRGRASDAPAEIEPAHVLTIRDGMIVRMRAYLHREQALEAAGLRE